MRISRHKAFKKSLRFFKAAFDYVDPYHVIVDPSFIDLAVKSEIRLNEDFSQLLAGRVTPMVTECIMSHLRKNGRTNTAALMMGKACYRLKCGHMGASCLSPSECVLSQLGTDNVRHFFVASQEDDLKAKARLVPGTPVLSLHGKLLMLESPSEESRKNAEHREAKRRLPKLSEVCEKETKEKTANESPALVAKSKQRKVKGVNPLAAKRKRLKPQQVQGESPVKKARVRSRRAIPLIDTQ